jgi:hypothetical protein
MTQQQYDRLPAVLREIVDIDRQLDELHKRVIVPFRAVDRTLDEFDLKGRRAGLRHAAEQLWGRKAAAGGPVHA